MNTRRPGTAMRLRLELPILRPRRVCQPSQTEHRFNVRFGKIEYPNMTFPDPQLAKDLNRNGVEFLLADLDTALTFTNIAASADRDEETRRRNRENARKAYDTVLKLSKKFALKPEEKMVFDEKLQTLRRALERLGQVL